jgi:hypothetical protein
VRVVWAEYAYAQLETLPRMSVVAGANASGKPTLFDDTHVLHGGGRGVRSPPAGW